MIRRYGFCILALCLAVASAGCSRSPRVIFYTLEPAAHFKTGASGPAAPRSAPAAVAPASVAPTTAAPTAEAPRGAAAATVSATAAKTPPTAAKSTTDAAAATGAVAAGKMVSVAVGPVTLPELMDRPQLVVRTALNRVAILETRRWAEPLRSQIPRVIAGNLSRQLGTSRVSSYLENVGADADYRVLLDVERFDAVPGEAVSVELVWSVRRTAGGASRTGRFLVREPAGGEGYDALVAAYGRALLAVSVDLAQAIEAEAAAGR